MDSSSTSAGRTDATLIALTLRVLVAFEVSSNPHGRFATLSLHSSLGRGTCRIELVPRRSMSQLAAGGGTARELEPGAVVGGTYCKEVVDVAVRLGS